MFIFAVSNIREVSKKFNEPLLSESVQTLRGSRAPLAETGIEKPTTIEQEIWDEFSELSQYDFYDFDENISCHKAKSLLGISYEDTMPKANFGGNQFIYKDVDKKIDEALLESGEINWDKIAKLYPKSELQFKYNFGKNEYLPNYPEPKFRTKKQWAEIQEFLLIQWEDQKEGLHLLFPNEEKAREYMTVKRWGWGMRSIVCPFYNVIGATRARDDKRFFCRYCRKQFSVTVGTIFQGTHLPLTKWYEAIFLLTSTKTCKLSTPQLAKAIDATQKTAWWVQDRVLNAVNDDFISQIKTELIQLRK